MCLLTGPRVNVSKYFVLNGLSHAVSTSQHLPWFVHMFDPHTGFYMTHMETISAHKFSESFKCLNSMLTYFADKVLQLYQLCRFLNLLYSYSIEWTLVAEICKILERTYVENFENSFSLFVTWLQSCIDSASQICPY